jgi:hypothetical protein
VSTLMTAEIVNVVVLAAVLEADLGSHRKITRFRVVRPFFTTAAIVPLFLEKVTTRGAGLTIELAGVAAGVLAGLIALTLMRVYRSGTGRPASAAGLSYALVWAAIVGARALFSYGSYHWFSAQLGQWMTASGVSGNAITDGLIFMAVAMVLVRAIGLGVRGGRLPAVTPASRRELQDA